jgi:nitronate monooxygenase
MNPCWPSFKKPRIYTFIFLARRVRYWKFINPRRILNESHILDSGNLLIRARRNGVVRGLAAAFALGAEGVQIGTAFLPCAASGASEAYRSALSLFAANGTDLTDAFTGRLARGIRNRLMNEFRHVSSPSLPFPVQHALTQTVATLASAQGTLELMTIWAGQNASLCHSTDATEFITQLIAEAESVFSKYWEAVSPVRETRDDHKG